MSKEIATREEQAIDAVKQPIVMKNGLVHWVSEDTARKVQDHLGKQTSHSFMRISELDITINSAEVNGVYTRKQYDDLQKVKQGMWQCPEGNWHKRTDKECFCAEEKRKARRAAAQQEKQQQQYAPLTKEQQQANKERLRMHSEHMVLSGLISHVGRTIRRSTLQEYRAANKPLKVDPDVLKIEEDII